MKKKKKQNEEEEEEEYEAGMFSGYCNNTVYNVRR